MRKTQRRTIEVEPGVSVSSEWQACEQGPGRAAVLAHGAGAGMDHEFMVYFQRGLVAGGISTVRFNFPYMERGRRAPDRAPLLESTFRSVIGTVRREWSPAHLFIGGKSMGGRMASHLAAQGEKLSGLFLLGYPLHPPGRPERMRREHLPQIDCPCLFVQGTRDNLCDLALLRRELSKMPAPVDLFIVEGGNHSFDVPAASGKTRAGVREEILSRLLAWMTSRGN